MLGGGDHGAGPNDDLRAPTTWASKGLAGRGGEGPAVRKQRCPFGLARLLPRARAQCSMGPKENTRNPGAHLGT
jgi:hypothetical protein